MAARVRGGVGVLALHLGSSRGHLDAVRKLLAQGADVNGKTVVGATSLMGASFHGHAGLVKLLLDFDARVDDATDQGVTSLMMAADNLELLKELVSAGANLSAFQIAQELDDPVIKAKVLSELNSP